jgi:hypothetical protein
MLSREKVFRLMPGVLWLLAALTTVARIVWERGNGWSATPMLLAVRAVHAGRDPYVGAIQQEAVMHAAGIHGKWIFFYLYSPMLTPLLRALGNLPKWVLIAGYWAVYAACVLAVIWVCLNLMEEKERRWFALLAPAVAFFPGLIQKDAVLGGNVAFILYGMIFVTALVGWRRGQWIWFYAATLAVSCVKIPLLILLLIPVLSARRQWFAAAAAGVIGLLLFAIQPLIWPEYFKNYLHAISLEYGANHGFGFGPAGILGRALSNLGVGYSSAMSIFYFAYAIPLAGLLFYLSRRYLAGKMTLESWVPVMLTGVIFLTPRVQEYDVAPVSLLMAVLLWRGLKSLMRPQEAVEMTAMILVVMNLATVVVDRTRSIPECSTYIEGTLLILVFALGCRDLLQQKQASYHEMVNTDVEMEEEIAA